MSINYIIATYAGIYRPHENKEFVLQKQLGHLYHIFASKYDQRIPNHIKRITVVCPTPKETDIYPKYYQKALWKHVFQSLSVPIEFVDYIGQNIDHSYDQWIQGYLAYPDCDYNIFTEDDYCVDKHALYFDTDLINMYKTKFPDNLGYLATWCSEHNGHELHAAISNGVISTKTMNQFSDPLDTYYNMIKYHAYPQLKFSGMFTLNGIPIDDFATEFQALFWNSETKEEINYSMSDTTERLFIPVQSAGLDTTTYNKRKKVAFFVGHFSSRGSEIAIYDYACYNEVILENVSIFITPSNYKEHRHPSHGLVHNNDIEQKFRSTFPVYEYRSISELETILIQQECDVFYCLKSGEIDNIVSLAIPTVVHCVFTCIPEQSHGAVYAAISSSINKANAPIVPHICTRLPTITSDLRQELGIPTDAVVFGRHGGYESFDIPFVYETIQRSLRDRDDIWFLFMNTQPFAEPHPRIIHLPENTDLSYKSRFILTCNAMLHARTIGESFGMAIAEFSSLHVPIITWKHGGPRNQSEDIEHLNILGKSGIYYKDADSLYKILTEFDLMQLTAVPYMVDYTKIYDPIHVMRKFDDLLLQPIFTKNKLIRIQLLSNFATSAVMAMNWRKLIGPFPIKLVESNPDYFVIINKPPEDAIFDPAKTIVMGMEPDTFTGSRWNWYGADEYEYTNKSSFMYFLDENYQNNFEWWLNKDFNYLRDTSPDKTKGDRISTIVSSQYIYPGHKHRIDFLKTAESYLDIDIYGWDNVFNFSKYAGKLDSGKDDGLLPYKYTIAFENTSRPNYITEKLVDAILAECLCFYWGCPNIDEHFDTRCFIRLDMNKNPLETINNAISNDLWSHRLPFIRAMKQTILHGLSFAPRLYGLIKIHELDKAIVNLDNRPDKLSATIDACRSAQLHSSTRFPAIRGEQIDPEFIKENFILTHNFIGPKKNTNAIIGCAMSHYKLWCRVAESHKPMLILEDDVTFEPRFIERFAAIWSLLYASNTAWDVLFLGYHNHEANCDEHCIPYTYLSDRFGIYELTTYNYMTKFGTSSDASGLHGGGTFAYMISPSGAKKMKNMIAEHKFYFPVDYQILECGLRYGLNILVCPHKLITSPKFGLDTLESDIQG